MNFFIISPRWHQYRSPDWSLNAKIWRTKLSIYNSGDHLQPVVSDTSVTCQHRHIHYHHSHQRCLYHPPHTHIISPKLLLILSETLFVCVQLLRGQSESLHSSPLCPSNNATTSALSTSCKWEVLNGTSFPSAPWPHPVPPQHIGHRVALRAHTHIHTRANTNTSDNVRWPRQWILGLLINIDLYLIYLMWYYSLKVIQCFVLY